MQTCKLSKRTGAFVLLGKEAVTLFVSGNLNVLYGLSTNIFTNRACNDFA